MKLIKTENRNGTPNGYFDPSTGFHYTVDGEHPFWVIARLPTGAAVRLTQVFVEYDDADAELDRIAALIEGEAPVQGWVAGAPPHDGNYYVVLGFDDGPCVVSGHPASGPNDDYDTPSGSSASRRFITHYLPLPQEP